MRLSPIIWKENRRIIRRSKLIDLGDVFLDKQAHSRYWKEETIPLDGFILKPGQRILGRIDEEIQIPLDCLGKIEARSGMNRLLLVITLGDFINPGYKGHYPLQIINMSSHRIKIYSRISVCQLLLSELSSVPEKRFSESASSYHKDNGGPACWWEDRQTKLFMKENSTPDKELMKKIISFCYEYGQYDFRSVILSRFRGYYKKLLREHKNPEHAIDSFLKREKYCFNRRKLFILLIKALIVTIPALVTIGLFILDSNNTTNTNIFIFSAIFWVIVFIIVLLIVSLLVYAIYRIEQWRYLVKNKDHDTESTNSVDL